ncbi:hypothetical protein VB773_18190 [Haloarculaceae archaeon H-GB2-1]|nr:hypothetical protein [Haloarculaceae archaeon H-GB11]MEA5409312.1 hypothetical protein [Haloarculaceae archaeon H-GB2-1]
MSSISPSANDRPDVVEHDATPDVVSATIRRLADASALQTTAFLPLRAIGFWAAICLPFVALALLVNGYAAENGGVFALLLCANVTALVLGRNHHAE